MTDAGHKFPPAERCACGVVSRGLVDGVCADCRDATAKYERDMTCPECGQYGDGCLGHASSNRVPRDGDRVALEPCFQAIPKDRQKVAACVICGAPYTRLTELHWKANACTGCMLRTLRPFDYTHATPNRVERDPLTGLALEFVPAEGKPIPGGIGPATRNRAAEIIAAELRRHLCFTHPDTARRQADAVVKRLHEAGIDV